MKEERQTPWTKSLRPILDHRGCPLPCPYADRWMRLPPDAEAASKVRSGRPSRHHDGIFPTKGVFCIQLPQTAHFAE